MRLPRSLLLGTSHITTPATLAAGRIARRPLDTAAASRHRGREATERETLGTTEQT